MWHFDIIPFHAKTYYEQCIKSSAKVHSGELSKGVVSLENKDHTIEPPRIRHEIASEFIHKLSHDITGITHNIMGYATLLEEDNNPDYIKGISRLITKLNDKVKAAVSKIDDGLLNEG